MQWADLSQSDENINSGVSLLNDCKHGYDSQPSQLRLTLLRSPEWPHAAADRGIHSFCYALYPHRGNWQSAETVHRGYELNQPLLVVRNLEGSEAKPFPLKGGHLNAKPAALPPTGQFLHLNSPNLILTALKQAEQGDRWILRVYECEGRSAELTLSGTENLLSECLSLNAKPTNLLEQRSDNLSSNEATQTFQISPWQIATFIL